MIIESTLDRQEFIRYSLTGHFRRPAFYVFASVASFMTAYGFLNPALPLLFYVAAWTPMLVYTVGGAIVIIIHGRNEGLPIYLPTRYEFTKRGVELSTRSGRSNIPWSDLGAWRKVVGLYELAHANGQLLLISGRAVPAPQVASFEQLLARHIGPKPAVGVSDA